MKKLGNPQQEIYAYLVSYYQENGYPPSVREIGQAVGLLSTSTVHTHLKNMEKLGLITRDPSKQRAIIINQPAESRKVAAVSTAVCPVIPLLGRVAAGQPILAEDNIEDAFAVPPILLHGNQPDETFMLHVKGDSMVNAGICDGDIIVVDRALQYEDGDIVVARTHEEAATVKRIYRERDQVRLQPENETYQPILLPYNEVEIVGRVVGLMRRM